MTSLRSGVKLILMKKLSTYLFLILFSFSAPSFADDISDFQIEGMSIGDSALDFFSEEEIKRNKKNWYKNKEITGVEIKISSSEYNKVQIHHRTNDKTYKMIGISGIKFYRDNIEQCYKKQSKIVEELKEFFPNINPTNKSTKHTADKSGKSKIKFRSYHLKSGDIASTACYDWSKKMTYSDHLRIGLLTSDLNNWFKIAFK